MASRAILVLSAKFGAGPRRHTPASLALWTIPAKMRFSVILLLTLPFLSVGQTIVDYPVNESLIGTWETANSEDYEGVYRFGMSEWESEFYLAVDGNTISAQVKDHEWIDSEDENLKGWQSRYRNYHNVKIVGNKFYSDETEGEFVTYKFEGEQINGLKLKTPPNSYDDKYEIGIFQTEDKLIFFSGEYAKTKFEIMSNETLSSIPLEDLKIMRNEIFARYGHVFNKGGAMAEHFGRQKWYHPIERDVSQLLTDIELQNIANIRAAEAKKKSP